jgi:hypothetical protein
VTAIEEVQRAAEPALRRHAREPGPGDWSDYTLEAVYEGYLLHYGNPRAFDMDDDDLKLLAGDALYAQGLARLAEQGRLDAVAELADLITGCARAQAEGRPADIGPLWEQSAGRLSG